MEISCNNGRSFVFSPNKTALLVIDMQRDFCCQGGYGHLAGGDVRPLQSIIPRIREVLDTARSLGLLIVHTREGHLPDLSDCPQAKQERSRYAGAEIGAKGPLGRFLIRGEFGHDFVNELTPLPGELVIDKPGFGAFYKTNLENLLEERGITHLIFTGVTTEVCVHSTLREAVDRGFYCLLLEDCCAAYDRELHQAAVRMIESEGGIFGWVSRAEEFLKAISSLKK
jgi:nicotinamidase-related amidase